MCSSADTLIESWRHYGMSKPALIDEALRRNDPAALAAAALGASTWWPDLDAINAPSLWYIGSAEGGFYDEEVQYAAAHDVETHEIPDATHWAAFAGAEQVASIVKPFLLRCADR